MPAAAPAGPYHGPAPLPQQPFTAGKKRGGMLDFSGMLHRFKTRHELKQHFEVVADDHAGPRAPNQVTRGEFKEISRMHSDIMRGRSDLKIDSSGMSKEDAAKFHGGTKQDLTAIMQTPSGRNLLKGLHENPGGHTTTVSQAPDPLAASASAQGPGANQPGVGAGGKIQYAPGQSVSIPGGSQAWSHTPLPSDAVLYHELNHGEHYTRGVRKGNMVAAGPGVPASDVGHVREEEHQTVGLASYEDVPISENRYRGERNQLAGRHGAKSTDGTLPKRTTYDHR